MQRQTESAEGLVYEFRKESFTGIYEVERSFIQKIDELRKALQQVCRHLNININFVLS